MVKPSLFRTYVLLSSLITAGVVFVGAVSARYLTHLQADKMTPPNSPIFIARILDQIDSSDHAKAFDKITAAIDENSAYDVWLLNQDGSIIKSRKGLPLPFNWSAQKLPIQPYDFASIEKAEKNSPHFTGIVKLQGPSNEYLAFEFKPKNMTGKNYEFFLFQCSLLISIITASLL